MRACLRGRGLRGLLSLLCRRIHSRFHILPAYLIGGAERGVYDMRRKKEEYPDELKDDMRPVHCPVCGRRVLDAVLGTRTQLVTPLPGRYPDFIVKCGHCGAEVGVIKN